MKVWESRGVGRKLMLAGQLLLHGLSHVILVGHRREMGEGLQLCVRASKLVVTHGEDGSEQGVVVKVWRA